MSTSTIPDSEQALADATLLLQELLEEFTKSESASSSAQGVFGANWMASGNFFFSQWASGDFSSLPTFKILSADALGGASGAFSQQTGNIYVSSALLLGTSSQTAGVLLEEVGHWVDAQINNADTPGDEGEIFSAVVRGTTPGAGAGTENDYGTITVNGQSVAAELSNGIATTQQMASLRNGINAFFDPLDTALATTVMAENLPLVGKSLEGVSNQLAYVVSLRDTLLSGLNAAENADQFAQSQLNTYLTSALQTAGLGGITVTVDADGVRLNVASARASESKLIGLEAGLGLPGLGIATTGNVSAGLGYNFNFGIGVDGGGFYLDTTTDDFKIALQTTLPNAALDFKLGLLNFKASDAGSSFAPTFSLNLNDVDGVNDGKLRSFGSDFLDASLSGAANLRLNLVGDMGASALPSINTQLAVGWNFGTLGSGTAINPFDLNTNFGGVPTVAFNNVSIGLGSFFSGMVRPILDKIGFVIEPLHDVLNDVLLAPIPILTDIKAIVPIFPNTFIDIAVWKGDITQAQADDIKLAATVVSSLKSINTSPNVGDARINLGGFDLTGYDPRVLGFSLAQAAINPLGALLDLQDILSQNTAYGNFSVDIKGVTDQPLLAGTGIHFNIIEDPKTAFNLLLGKDVELFSYDMDQIDLSDVHLSEFISLAGPLGVRLTLDFDALLDLDFGFDTRGLRQFAQGGTLDDIINGLWVKVPEEGILQLDFASSVSAELNVIVASVGAGGGISGSGFISLPVNAVATANSPAKAYISNFFDKLGSNKPLTAFDAQGAADYSLFAYAEVGFNPVSLRYEKTLTSGTLFDFYDKPRKVDVERFYGYALYGDNRDFYTNLGPVLTQDNPLIINVGSFAGRRYDTVNGEYPADAILDVSERVYIKHLEGDFNEEVFGVTYELYKYTPPTFTAPDFYTLLERGTTRNTPEVDSRSGAGRYLYAEMGQEDDRIEFDPTIWIPARFFGGDGSDTLIGARGGDTLDGGPGYDYLVGNAGNDSIRGGDQDDKLFGGHGDDNLDGGEGDDELSGGTGNDSFFGGAGNDLFFAGEDLNGLDENGNRLDGGQDTLNGGDGVDTASYFFSNSGVTILLAPISAATGQLQNSGDGSVTGNGSLDVLISIENAEGSNFADTISGTNTANFLRGFGGNDSIVGYGDNDTIEGGTGADNLSGGNGWDVLVYGASAAGVNVNLATGAVSGGEAQGDSISGFEEIWGSGFNDTLTGSNTTVVDSGNNRIFGGDGDDIISGLGANDSLYGQNGDDRLDGGDGNDLLDGAAGNDTLVGGAGNDLLTGGDGNDSLTAGAGDDTLNGGAGDDYLISAGPINGGIFYVGNAPASDPATRGNDILDGGAGVNRLAADFSDQFIHAITFVSGQTNNIEFFTNPNQKALNFQKLGSFFYTGSQADTVIIDGAGDENFSNDIRTGRGHDTVDAGMGDDYIDGGEDNDLLYGGQGGDTIYGGDGNDYIFAEEGSDVVDAGAGDDSVDGGAGNDILDGGAGVDSIFYLAASTGVFVDLTGALISTDGQGGSDLLAGFERVFGSGGNDTITLAAAPGSYAFGSSGNDRVNGSSASDTVDGGTGNDTIIGGAGDDSLFGNADNDSVLGGTGNDTLDGSTGNDFLDAGDGDNTLIGGDGHDTILALDGNDSVDGGAGNDWIEVGNGNNQILAGSGLDTVTTGSGNDSVDLGEGDDFADVGSGRDMVSGGSGNDVLHAGNLRGLVQDEDRNDSLLGGAGFDAVSIDFSNQNGAFSITAGNTHSFNFADGARATDFETVHDFATSSGDFADQIFLNGASDDGFGNFLLVYGGDDSVRSGLGNDVVRLGNGNDSVNGGQGADTLDGGTGIDLLDYSTSSAGVNVNLITNATNFGDALGDVIQNFEQLIGSESNDTLTLVESAAPQAFGLGGNDSITGTALADTIDGGEGNDLVDAGVGTDSVIGGAGNDVLRVGNLRGPVQDMERNDTLLGGEGFDAVGIDFSNQTGAFSITAGNTHSYIFADGARATDFETVHDFATSSGNFDDLLKLDGASDDGFSNFLLVFGGNDTVFAGRGNDSVDAGTGNDFVSTGGNSVVLSGGRGFETATSGREIFQGGAGNDTISFEQLLNRTFQSGGGSTTTFEVGIGINLATGVGSLGATGVTATGFENVIGTMLGDNLVGTDGDNLFMPLAGGGHYVTSGGVRIHQGSFDSVSGAAGNDTLRIDFSSHDTLLGGVTSNLDFNSVKDGSYSRSPLSGPLVQEGVNVLDIEQFDFIGTSYADDLESANWGFNDTLVGLGGNDTINGRGGSDTLLGGDGNDTLIGNKSHYNVSTSNRMDGRDFLDGGAGDDFVDNFYQFIQLTDYIPLPGFYSQLDGGTGFDRLSANFALLNEAIVWTSAAPTNLEFADGQYARNFEQIVSFVSGGGNDNISQLGRVDNYYTHLGAGDDTLNLGLGKDQFLEGGSGNDLLIIDFSVNDDGTPVSINGSGGYQRGTGTLDSVNFITGFERFLITGTAQNDTIPGRSGTSDTIYGGAGNDSIDGISGQKYFDGGDGNDTLRGSRDVGTADTLIGGAGNDLLDGRSVGSDSLVGGDGNDLLYLNSGGSAAYLQDFADGGAGDDEVFNNNGGASNNYGNSNALSFGALLRLDGGTGSDTLSADFSNQSQAIIWNQASPTGMDFSDGAYFRNFEFLKNFATGAGNDSLTLSGRVDNDIFLANGDDTVNAGLGKDTLNGGNGTDLLIVNFSADDAANLNGVTSSTGSFVRTNTSSVIIDQVSAQSFEKYFITGAGKADRLIGHVNDDTLIGNAGNDTLEAISGNDSLVGGDGDDSLLVETTTVYGTDYAQGGAGNDLVKAGFASQNFSYANGTTFQYLDGGEGTDTLSADFGNQSEAIAFQQGVSNSKTFANGTFFKDFEFLADFASGSGNDSIMLAGRANNTINLGAGDDTLNPGLGIDAVHGAGGNDLIILDYSLGDDVNVGGLTGTSGSIFRRNTITSATVDSISISGFERMAVTGGSKADSLSGGTGADTIIGGDGNDTIEGQSGNDSLLGGAGNDLISVFSESARLDFLDGGEGTDTLGYATFANQTAAVVFNNASPTGTIFADGAGFQNFETILRLDTGAGNDSITQLGRLDNSFFTGAGNDTINAGLGRDTVNGEAGTDLLIADFSQGDDANLLGVSNANGFFDRRNTSNASVDRLDYQNIEQFQITGGSKADTLNGGSASDTLIGGAGNDSINGGAGADSLVGGLGNDTITIDQLGDVVVELAGAGTDTVIVNASISHTLGLNIENGTISVSGGAGTTLTGNMDNNVLTGNTSSNTLSGLRGNDTLIGDGTATRGTGSRDTLTGGLGADTFVLGTAAGRFYDDNNAATAGISDYALITDFNLTQGDKLQLFGAISQYFLGSSPVNGVAGTGVFFDSNNSSGFDSATDELLAIVNSSAGLNAGNFLTATRFVS